jgi:Domain of unknown function (DUF4260)
MTTQSATTIVPRGLAGRTAYAILAALLLAAVSLEALTQSTGYWQIAAFGLGPDLALFAGFGAGLAKGQLHSRAVPAYNLLHRFWGPLALALLAAFQVISLAFFIGALTWAFHIALDRALGYGLRTRDGFQRP